MIVVGVDVHKQSLTAVAVDEVGRSVAELTVGSARELVNWSTSLDPERLWAVEDCRQLSGALERALLTAGESLVRVPPKLMAPQRLRWQLHDLDPELIVPHVLRQADRSRPELRALAGRSAARRLGRLPLR